MRAWAPADPRAQRILGLPGPEDRAKVGEQCGAVHDGGIELHGEERYADKVHRPLADNDKNRRSRPPTRQ
jgi:hypothetical protein